MDFKSTTTRYRKCKTYMNEENIDVVVAISPENVLYFSNTYIMTQTDLRERLAITIMPLESEPIMIACDVERATVEEETWISDKRYYVEFEQSPIQFLVEALRERGLENKRVGIELDYLMAHFYKELIESMPNTEFVMCTRIFDKVRMIKEEREIEILSNAGFQTRKAFEAAILMTKPGDTEADLANKTIRNLFDLGCEDLDFICLASGERTPLVHGLPQEIPLVDGDMMRIDFGGIFDNYISDVARTALIGNRNRKYVEVFDRLAEVYMRTFEKLKVGVPAFEVYNCAKKHFGTVGLPFSMAHIGHGIGLGPHEMPILSPFEKQILMEDMVLCLELSVNINNRYYHVEDLIRITSEGPRVLTQSTLNPQLLHIC